MNKYIVDFNDGRYVVLWTEATQRASVKALALEEFDGLTHDDVEKIERITE